MDPYIGQIIMFGGNFAIRGYAACQNQILSIAQNSALFSILGTMYGGDGRVSFALPDMRGRSVVGSGAGPGLSSISVGQKGGVEEIVLSQNQLPAHTHSATFTQTSGTVSGKLEAYNNGAGRVEPVVGDYVSGNAAQIFGTGGGFGAAKVELGGLTVTSPPVTGTIGVGTAGASTPVYTRNPFQSVTVQIALVGVYPSRT